ncbi:RNA polymerase factor sigma-54 [Terracidiphilus sp.]|jgi:RNA polymerase sigma-54 factor|uniref:RNA polymerase factor sigma-54 n=1 Tax=Terracidiphilus sp. TaxID=1964191 RepID=UPI003C1AB4DE
MALLQPKLNLRVSQRQVLTPGLMQMVSVLALNKLELKEMIDAELVENPVLEEIDETVPMLDQVASREETLGLSAERVAEEITKPKDPFEEVDFGSYFQEYLDPGYKTQPEYEDGEKPSFENFLSQPTTLTDHLSWQLGALSLDIELSTAAEFIVGNLDENGYLAAGDEELAASFAGIDPTVAVNGAAEEYASALQLIKKAIKLVQHLDPAGVGARDLRECLLVQVAAQQGELAQLYAKRSQVEVEPEAEEKEEEDYADLIDANPHGSFRVEAEAKLEERRRAMDVAGQIVDKHLALLQKRDVKDLARAVQATVEEAHAAVEFIRTLDPRPGRLYNREQTRLIEPDVVFVKRGGEWVVSMNEEDLPSLRLSRRYRQMLASTGTEREVKEYVKERFRSAMQLMRNIAQRKSTILRTCEVIVRRQQEFLDKGIEALRPMMIKEVAEEIGVHPSTVSRAVANKYAHTPQGVLELRFFFSEGSNGPEGADTPLVVLKRKVRKLIEEEDAKKPLTDDQLAALLQAGGIQLTRRTVAKYREEMNIPSTHQRRRRDA